MTLLATITLVAAACGDDPADDAAPTPGPDPTTSTPGPDAPEPTSTTPTPDPTAPSTPPEPTAPEPTPEPTAPGGGFVRCENPEGFSIAYPESWSTNPGGTVPACSQFDPGPFDVPDATDERVAAITAYVDDVEFHRVAAPDEGHISRATTEVGGHQAVRIVSEAGDDSIWPPGTLATRYVVDLSLGVDDGAGTLFLDTVDASFVDYPDAERTLDEMFRTLELTGPFDTVDDAVARYEGGGGSITVTADAADPGLCLTFEQADVSECVAAPDPTGVTTTRLGDDLSPVVVGASGAEVFRLVAVQTDGDRIAYLPTAVDDTDLRGWAVPGTLDEIAAIETYSLAGEALGATSFADSAAGT